MIEKLELKKQGKCDVWGEGHPMQNHVRHVAGAGSEGLPVIDRYFVYEGACGACRSGRGAAVRLGATQALVIGHEDSASSVHKARSRQCRGYQFTWFSAPYHDPNACRYWKARRTNISCRCSHYHLRARSRFGPCRYPQTSMLAFSDHGSLAPGDGNENIVECMDDDVIQIKNNTCSEFYIWVSRARLGHRSAHALRAQSMLTADSGGAPGSA